jgi:predicted acyltransferase
MSENSSQHKQQRLISLDALRGFDMFWIIGGQKIIFALSIITGKPMFNWLNSQMHHVEWNGFSFYDMIFPLFLFLAGVSMPFSFNNRLTKGESKKRLYKHAFIRMLKLVFLGMIFNHFLDLDFENMRYASVLSRIGIAWFIASIIYLNSTLKAQIIWFWVLLFIYYLLMVYIPVPGFGSGVLTLEGNLAGYVDRLFLPGKFYFEAMEPEGILSTIPSIGTALLGTFFGRLLLIEHAYISKYKKVFLLFALGIIALCLGKLWNIFFPINKYLWTSSFVLFSGGWCILLLGVFYLIIDLWGFKRWAFFFIVIGMNSITIYIVQHRIIDFTIMRDFLFSGLIDFSPDFIQPLVNALAYIACVWGFLYFLYRNKIFLKI